MELQGKTVCFLGDSITEGHVSPGLHGFVAMLAETYGIHAKNYGLHDTRIARQQTPSPYPQWDLDFLTRGADMESADLAVVFGGTNDYGTGDAPLGTPADQTPDTFYGALHCLFTLLKERYPTVVVLTPLPRLTEEDPQTGKSLASYVNAIVEMASRHRLPLLDLYTKSGLDPANAALMPDGLHPNEAGHQKLARQVGNFLLTL